MTKRTQFKKAIRTLEKLKNGQLIDTEDMKIDEIINLLKESCPKPYESRKKENCTCGAMSRQIKIWYGGGTYACRCEVCGKTGPWCKTEIEAIRSWNGSAVAAPVVGKVALETVKLVKRHHVTRIELP